LSSCTEEHFYFDAQDIPARGWALDAPVELEFETRDTSATLDFFFDVRNNDNYPYRNIYAFIELEFPNGRTLRDTVHYPYLATPEGSWTGQGAGSAYDNSILYKNDRKLPLPGIYKLRIHHGMRDSVLRGIERVGIHLSEINDG